MNSKEQIAFNKQAHDSVVATYKKMHTEIFNDIEQERLKKALCVAKESIDTNSETKTVLDVGCGSGNLTDCLSDMGMQVTASDVSQGFLDKMLSQNPNVDTLLLNGVDLDNVQSDSFDMVATYSVLHHIPDYLKMVSEMCRVLKPGGVLYIDHEKNENYWSNDTELYKFYRSQKWRMLPLKLKKLCTPMWYVHIFRRFKNSRYQSEGDIHVWSDDHVVWDDIFDVCRRYSVHVDNEMDFLLYDRRYKKDVYDEKKKTLTDTKAVVCVKKVSEQ